MRLTRSHSRPPLAHASWQALGTTVVLRCADPAGPAAGRAIVERELAAIDRACSRFRPDSELSLLNGRAGRSMHAGALLIEALELAIAAAQLTDGDVDPTVGRALELAGYDRDWSLLAPPREAAPDARGEDPDGTREAPAAAPALTLHSRAGWRTIELDAASRTVRIPPGVRLDLGATAKAWAADRAAAAVHADGGHGVLVALGGDIATAGTPPAGGWPVRVTDDHRSRLSAPGQTIAIRCGGLATSSTVVRRWSHRGHTMHHIIDPATAAPARTRWQTVSVAAADCAQANIASTAAILREDAAIAWLAGLGLPARLCDRDGQVTTVGDWPADGPAAQIDGVEARREPAVAR